MGRKKRIRYAAIETLDNVFLTEVPHRGQWRTYFQQEGPLVIELGCGTADLTLALAEKNPASAYIGMDLKSERLYVGATKAQALGLKNVAFIRRSILEITTCFAEHEVDELWITFPDPFPKNHQAKKRLTAPRLLNAYRRILKPDGVVHLKTDDENLFQYTLGLFEDENIVPQQIITEVHARCAEDDILRVTTRFERRHLAAGKTIKYVRFQFSALSNNVL